MADVVRQNQKYFVISSGYRGQRAFENTGFISNAPCPRYRAAGELHVRVPGRIAMRRTQRDVVDDEFRQRLSCADRKFGNTTRTVGDGPGNGCWQQALERPQDLCGAAQVE